MPKAHLVKINRSGSSLTAAPPVKTVRPNEKLKFQCDDDFAIIFKNDRNPHNPSTKVLSEEGGNETRALLIRSLTPSEKLNPGNAVIGDKFTYGVAVLNPGTGAILTLDPDIIIDDSGGGGGGGGEEEPAGQTGPEQYNR